MSNVFAISADLNTARLTAVRDYLDSATPNGYLVLYSGTRPSPGGAPTTAVVTITLARPSGTVSAGVFHLVAADTGGSQIMASGTVTWGRLYKGDGSWAADGDVTDESGDGAFKLAGTAGTTLYAGAYALLATAAIG